MHTNTISKRRIFPGQRPRLSPFYVVNGGFFRRVGALRIQSPPFPERSTRLDMRNYLA